jgi:hypothetical protein
MRMVQRAVSIIAVVVFAYTIGSGQAKRASVDAFNKLASRIAATTKNLEHPSFRIAAAALEPNSESSVLVQLSVGASLNITSFGSITVEAEPAVVSKSTVTVLGGVNKIKGIDVTRAESSAESPFYNPAIYVRTPHEANAVVVRIYGVGTDKTKPFTLILPIRAGIQTAGVSEISADDSAISDEACSWFLGYCETCTLCVGCSDNSPVLNCVECTMTCANGEPCTPSTPKPFDCP